MPAGMLMPMSGGMYGKRGPGVQLAERAGGAREVMPWEQPRSVAPRDAHVMLEVHGVWVQAFLVEQRHDDAGWVCRVIRAERNGPVIDEWVPAGRVRSRSSSR